MTLNILLINPNMMKSPPTIPIGLEYLATALRKEGYSVEILDLCFVSEPENMLETTLLKKSYDIIGITIRNIDSSLYYNNEFYLPSIKKLTQIVKKFKIPVVLGGAGFSAMPIEILNYLDGDYGIIGPGEVMLPFFLKMWYPNKREGKRIFDGWTSGINNDIINIRGIDIDYSQYVSNDGIIGFRTHSGCQNHCPYCIEANKKILLGNIPNILEELKYLINQGYSHFHLCDSEFNNDLLHSINFCKTLKKNKIALKWTLYMKPTPFNEELIKLLSETNAYLITLTVDSDRYIQEGNNYSYSDLDKFIRLCEKYNIELAIDLLTGYPHEPFDSTKRVINFFKKHRPTRVSINFYYRLAKYTPLTRLIMNEPSLQEKLTRKLTENEDFLKPIFYSHYSQEIIEDLIKDDDLFSIVGISSGVNYQFSEKSNN